MSSPPPTKKEPKVPKQVLISSPEVIGPSEPGDPLPSVNSTNNETNDSNIEVPKNKNPSLSRVKSIIKATSSSKRISISDPESFDNIHGGSHSLFTVPSRRGSSFSEIDKLLRKKGKNKKAEKESSDPSINFPSLDDFCKYLRFTKFLSFNKSFSYKVEANLFNNFLADFSLINRATTLIPSNDLPPSPSFVKNASASAQNINETKDQNPINPTPPSTSNELMPEVEKPIKVLMRNKWRKRAFDVPSSDSESDTEIIPRNAINVIKPGLHHHNNIARTLSSDSDVFGAAEMTMFQSILKNSKSKENFEASHPHTAEEQVRKLLLPPCRIKRKNFVAFDSDRESMDDVGSSEDGDKPVRSSEEFCMYQENDISEPEVTEEDLRTDKVNYFKNPPWYSKMFGILKPGMRSTITGRMRLGMTSKYKLVVSGLKCMQFLIALIWTLTVSLHEYVNKTVFILLYSVLSVSFERYLRKQFSYFGSLYGCLGIYFALYFIVNHLGYFHGKVNMWIVYFVMTMCLAHFSAVANLYTGYRIVPFILSVILLFGLCFFAKVYASTKTLDQLGFFEPTMILLALMLFLIMCFFTITTAQYIKSDPEFAITLASYHIGLATGCLYGVYVIHRIRSFATGGKITSMGQLKDYAFAAITII